MTTKGKIENWGFPKYTSKDRDVYLHFNTLGSYFKDIFEDIISLSICPLHKAIRCQFHGCHFNRWKWMIYESNLNSRCNLLKTNSFDNILFISQKPAEKGKQFLHCLNSQQKLTGCQMLIFNLQCINIVWNSRISGRFQTFVWF